MNTHQLLNHPYVDQAAFVCSQIGGPQPVLLTRMHLEDVALAETVIQLETAVFDWNRKECKPPNFVI